MLDLYDLQYKKASSRYKFKYIYRKSKTAFIDGESGCLCYENVLL